MKRRARSTVRRLSRWLACAALVSGNALAASSATAEQALLITGEPVEAAELGRMLYPLPTRAIVMTPPKSTPFGFLIQFEFDSARVKAESRPYLDEVGKMMSLRRLAGKQLMIVGHADASGGEAYNLGLSERRAEAVGQYLARVHGIELGRLVIGGLGESEPIDSSDPYAPRNRRVQFHPVD